MALVFGASSPFGAIVGVSPQSSNEMDEIDEALALDADGKIEKVCESNPRTAGSMEGIVAVCAGEVGVDVTIDLGAELNGYFMETASASQRNTDYPRLNFGGTLYDGVTIDDTTALSVEFTGLKYGVHFTPGVTGMTASRVQDASVTWSIQNKAEAQDNVGQMTEMRGITYRCECTGNVLLDADTLVADTGWKLKSGKTTANTGYQLIPWRAWKYESP
jgi:hypothetical protein